MVQSSTLLSEVNMALGRKVPLDQRHEAKLCETGRSIEEMRVSIDRIDLRENLQETMFFFDRFTMFYLSNTKPPVNVPFIEFWEDVMRQRTCHGDTQQSFNKNTNTTNGKGHSTNGKHHQCTNISKRNTQKTTGMYIYRFV